MTNPYKYPVNPAMIVKKANFNKGCFQVLLHKGFKQENTRMTIAKLAI